MNVITRLLVLSSSWQSHPKNHQLLPEYWLVVEPTPLKNMKVSWDHEIPKFGMPFTIIYLLIVVGDTPLLINQAMRISDIHEYTLE